MTVTLVHMTASVMLSETLHMIMINNCVTQDRFSLLIDTFSFKYMMM